MKIPLHSNKWSGEGALSVLQRKINVKNAVSSFTQLILARCLAQNICFINNGHVFKAFERTPLPCLTTSPPGFPQSHLVEHLNGLHSHSGFGLNFVTAQQPLFPYTHLRKPPSLLVLPGACERLQGNRSSRGTGQVW